MPSLAVLAGFMTVFASACPGDKVDALFTAYDDKHPSASVIVIKDGDVLFERSYGMSNLEKGEWATSQTNYRLASMTKQFTATSILILAERGKLSVDDLVSRYLPELASVAPTVTLRHLLTHTSGLPEYEALLPDDDKTPIADSNVLSLVAQYKAKVTPGGKFVYNNTGYALLALVVERVSQLSYPEFLRKNIFKPLGMTTTTVAGAASIPHRAYGYSGSGDQFIRADQTRSTTVLGDGGIYSSTRELVHWIDALEHNTLLSHKRLAEATSALVPTDKPNISYGFGWKISDFRGEKMVFHTGTTSGFKNVLVWIPSRKMGVIVLTNRKQGDPVTLAMHVLDPFWDP